MTQFKRITIVGCSVALRVRPPENRRNKNVNYGQLLESHLNNDSEFIWNISNLGLSRAISKEVLLQKDQIARSSPDFIVLNLGAVDAPSREIPLWFADILFQRNMRYFYPPIRFLYQYIIKPYLRRTLVYLRFKRSWTSTKKFKNDLGNIFSFFEKDTKAKVIVLGINQGNHRIENQLPGSQKKYKTYNDILKEEALKHDCNFIDVSDLNSEEHYPDGVHYNYAGHQEIMKRILPIIKVKQP